MAYITKSIIIDAADNYGNPNYFGARSIDFYFEGSLIPLTVSDFTADSTSDLGSTVEAKNLFITAQSKIGDSNGVSWISDLSIITNQRIICVFDSALIFDTIKINNYHSYGDSSTTSGIQNVKIYLYDFTVTSTVYAADTDDYDKLYDGTFDEHITSNVEDTQELTLIVFTDISIETDKPVLGAPTANTMDISTAMPVLGSPKGFGVCDDIVSGVPVVEAFTAVVMVPINSIITPNPAFISPRDLDIDIDYVLSLAIAIPVALTIDVGASINMELPSFNSTFNGAVGDVSSVVGSLPVLTYLANTGSLVVVNFPVLTCEISGRNQLLVIIESQLPSLVCQMIGSGQSDMDMESSFKAFQVVINTIVGSTADFNCLLPSLSLQNSGLTVNIGNVTAIMPVIKSDITSIITGDNDLEATINMLTCMIQADPLVDYILSYVKGKVR